MRIRIASLFAVCSFGAPTAVVGQDLLDGGFSPAPAEPVAAVAASPDLSPDAGLVSAGTGGYETVVTGSRVPRKDLTGPGAAGHLQP